MNHQISAASLILASLSLAALQGCHNGWVSDDEYYSTAISPDDSRMDSSDTTIYGYVPPPVDARPDDRPLLTPRQDEPPRIIIRDSVPPVVDQPLSHERSTYALETRDKLESLQRDLDRAVAKARQKGASAQAAIDPKVRDFDTARRDIESQMSGASTVSVSIWQDRTTRIDLALSRARRAVMEASNLADTTPPTQNPELQS